MCDIIVKWQAGQNSGIATVTTIDIYINTSVVTTKQPTVLVDGARTEFKPISSSDFMFNILEQLPSGCISQLFPGTIY